MPLKPSATHPALPQATALIGPVIPESSLSHEMPSADEKMTPLAGGGNRIDVGAEMGILEAERGSAERERDKTRYDDEYQEYGGAWRFAILVF